MESYARQTVHNGLSPDKPWGGCPIVILVGDDYQLPPVMPGAFDALICMDPRREVNHSVYQSLKSAGKQLFRDAGQDVMNLKTVKRVLESQVRLQRILKGVRGEPGDTLSEEDIAFLCNFHLNKSFTEREKKELDENSCIYSQTRNRGTPTINANYLRSIRLQNQ